ncbi:MAG: WD40 repeat domain-containing protein [Anaerolineales bacterium]|nr:WD40 repeat domain-containing protein [Anaerolineales bacterium]
MFNLEPFRTLPTPGITKIKQITLSPNGQLLALQDDKSSQLIVINIEGKLLAQATLSGPQKGLTFWPNSESLLFLGHLNAGDYGYLQQWEYKTGKITTPFKYPQWEDSYSDRFTMGKSKRYLVQFPPPTKNEPYCFCLDTKQNMLIKIPTCYSATFSSDDEYLAISGGSNISLVNLKSHQSFILQGIKNYAWYILFAFSPNNSTFIGTYEGILTSWHQIAPNQFKELPITVDKGRVISEVTFAEYVPQSEALVIGDKNGSIIFLEHAQPSQIRKFNNVHSHPIEQILFSVAGTEMYTIDKETILFWRKT